MKASPVIYLNLLLNPIDPERISSELLGDSSSSAETKQQQKKPQKRESERVGCEKLLENAQLTWNQLQDQQAAPELEREHDTE